MNPKVKAERDLQEALGALERLRETWLEMIACLGRIEALKRPQSDK